MNLMIEKIIVPKVLKSNFSEPTYSPSVDVFLKMGFALLFYPIYLTTSVLMNLIRFIKKIAINQYKMVFDGPAFNVETDEFEIVQFEDRDAQVDHLEAFLLVRFQDFLVRKKIGKPTRFGLYETRQELIIHNYLFFKLINKVVFFGILLFCIVGEL